MRRIKRFLVSVFLVLLAVTFVPKAVGQLGSTEYIMKVSAASYTKKTLLKNYSTTLSFKKKVKSCKSANTSIVTVKRTGSKKIKITAKKKGTAVVTVKFSSGGTKRYKVTVENPKISSKKLVLTVGDSVKLKITGTTKSVTWKSSKSSVVKVSSKGKITAKKAGSAVITATVGDKKKLTCKVTVKKKKTPVMTPYETAKTAVSQSSLVDSSGHPYIIRDDGGDYVYTITYFASGDFLEFGLTKAAGDSTISSSLYMDVASASESYDVSGKVYIMQTMEDAPVPEIWNFQFAYTFDRRKYTDNYMPVFEVKLAPPYLNMDSQLEAMKTLATAQLRLGFVVWDGMLENYAGYGMNEIGFVQYD